MYLIYCIFYTLSINLPFSITFQNNFLIICIIDIIEPQVAYFTRKRPFPIPLLYYLCWYKLFMCQKKRIYSMQPDPWVWCARLIVWSNGNTYILHSLINKEHSKLRLLVVIVFVPIQHNCILINLVA